MKKTFLAISIVFFATQATAYAKNDEMTCRLSRHYAKYIAIRNSQEVDADGNKIACVTEVDYQGKSYSRCPSILKRGQYHPYVTQPTRQDNGTVVICGHGGECYNRRDFEFVGCGAHW